MHLIFRSRGQVCLSSTGVLKLGLLGFSSFLEALPLKLRLWRRMSSLAFLMHAPKGAAGRGGLAALEGADDS